MRKIKYKELSENLETKVAPGSNVSRASIGIDKDIGEFYYIEIDKLKPYKNQARTHFKDEEIADLAESIKQHGVRQPLTVSKDKNDGLYEIISGERRYRATKLTNLKRIPCIILKDNESGEEIALIENLHREDLHPIEFGKSCSKLLEKGNAKSQAELARKLSVSEGKISEALKLSLLPDDIKQHMLNNNITSREKLRSVIANFNDTSAIRKIIGLEASKRLNFSVLRVLSTEKGFSFQRNGIRRLSKEQREQLKYKLKELLKELD